MPGQIIREPTDHLSNAVFANKRTSSDQSSDQKSAVSDILQMKPKIRKLNQETEARNVSDENVETSLLPTESCSIEEYAYAKQQLSSKCRPKQNTNEGENNFSLHNYQYKQTIIVKKHNAVAHRQ